MAIFLATRPKLMMMMMMNRQCGEPFAPAVRYALRFEHVSIREEDVVSEVYWSEQDAHAPDYRLNADFQSKV